MEEVFCIPRKSIARDWPAPTILVEHTYVKLEHWFNKGKFLPRQDTESSEKWVQLIPYVVFARNSRKEFAFYYRSGTEQRLHGLVSIGYGGHINPIDDAGTVWELLWNCAEREIREELGQVLPRWVPGSLVPVIISGENAVSRAHVGVVLIYDDISWDNLRYAPVDALRSKNLESWSRAALEYAASGRNVVVSGDRWKLK